MLQSTHWIFVYKIQYLEYIFPCKSYFLSCNFSSKKLKVPKFLGQIRYLKHIFSHDRKFLGRRPPVAPPPVTTTMTTERRRGPPLPRPMMHSATVCHTLFTIMFHHFRQNEISLQSNTHKIFFKYQLTKLGKTPVFRGFCSHFKLTGNACWFFSRLFFDCSNYSITFRMSDVKLSFLIFLWFRKILYSHTLVCIHMQMVLEKPNSVPISDII